MDRGIAVGVADTRPMLWAKLGPVVAATVKPTVVQMVETAGHQVLFTPPHYSGSQPIETVLAIVKGQVGRQYTANTSFKAVLKRLRASFAGLTQHAVKCCIHKANENLAKLAQYIHEREAVDDASSDSLSDEEANDADDDEAEVSEHESSNEDDDGDDRDEIE